VKTFAFALTEFFSGPAGMAMVARASCGNPFVGGTAITGGVGGLIGRTLIGVPTISVLRVGIAVIGLDPAYEPIAYGVLVAGAVTLVDRSKTVIVK
jgi:ribose transport system permease protein